MDNHRSIRVRVPATTANCGPGFDTLGIACTLYNELELTLHTNPGVTYEIHGEGEKWIPQDDRNIVWRAISHLLEKADLSTTYPGAHIRMKNEIPISRGLGSSAAAIVAGLKAANILVGNRFNRRELLQLATDIEGHPDNVAPAIFGGFTISSYEKGQPDCFSFLPKVPLKFVVAIPDFPLSTRAARKVLPEKVLLRDAIFNVGKASLLIAALCRGNLRFLSEAFEDRLHQPYRQNLIPGMQDVFAAARKAGALGAVISGAGPSLIAFTVGSEQKIAQAMQNAFAQHQVKASCRLLDIDSRGVCIVK